MELRPYQKRAFVAVARAFLNRAVNKQVIVLATGLGKTVIFSEAIRRSVHTTSKKALILAHREELPTQAADKLHMIDPKLRIGFEQANRRRTLSTTRSSSPPWLRWAERRHPGSPTIGPPSSVCW